MEQWRTGTRETEVRLDGWCEGGLRQQRNDCGAARDNARKIGKSPGTYVTGCVSRGHFCLALCCFGPPSNAGGYHIERGWMPLHDAVGIKCKKGATTENQGSGVNYMG